MIYTGSFRNIGKYMAAGYIVIGITRFPPKELKKYGLDNIEFLSPSKELLLDLKNGKIASDYFAKCYLKYLSDNEECIKDIVSWMSQCSKDVVLCCYEKSHEFCHRHILADFISRRWTKVEEK